MVFSENHTPVLVGTLKSAQPAQTSCHLHIALNLLRHSTHLRYLGGPRQYMDTDDFLVTVTELLGFSKLLFWISSF